MEYQDCKSNTMRKPDRIVIFSVITCLIACTGEIVTIFLAEGCYPGYNPLKNTMSSLGASNSPVSDQISLWWIIMGFLFIFYAIGFK